MDSIEKEPVAEAGGDEAGATTALEEPRLTIQQVIALQGRIAVEQQANQGAGWLGFISWLTIVNVVLMMGNARVTFVGALDLLVIVNRLALYLGGGPLLWGAALFLNMTGAGLFFFLKKKATEKKLWAFRLGLLLFSLDGLCGYMWTNLGWLSLIFHFIGLRAIWHGLEAAQTIRAIDAAAGERMGRGDEPILVPPPGV